ncbi:MAG TPA: hypothetical protein VI968_00260 [archaeon]|nr:hypothetical protein [archaeon]
MHHIENIDYVIILIVIMIGLLLLLLGENIQNASGRAFFSNCDMEARENSVFTESVLSDKIVVVSYNKCAPSCMTVTNMDLDRRVISEKTVCGS